MNDEQNPVNPNDIVKELEQEDESARKMAAFRLQSLIADPSFADVFIMSGGMKHLRFLALKANGNTLAYSLASLSNLLSLDQGWDWVNSELIHRLVNLIVGQPLVNILRGAMSVLAAIVQHPPEQNLGGGESGFGALKPAIDAYPEFLDSLVQRLSSHDHSLCLNALQLLNALMRDSMSHAPGTEWPRFIKRLQDLGVIRAVHGLMLDAAAQDLAPALLEFQSLMKILLRKWRDIAVDLDLSEHRRSLRSIWQAANPGQPDSQESDALSTPGRPDKWRSLGFETESPQWEFDEVGYLGMMDLTDFARKQEDNFPRLVAEQLSKKQPSRCPIARACIAVSSILYDHFDVDDADAEPDMHGYGGLESRNNIDKLFRPLMLQWSRLHSSGVMAFLRLWQTTGATEDDFGKIDELVRILVEEVVGLSPRMRDVSEIETMLAAYDLNSLRELQMKLLEVTHEESWGRHLRQVKEELHHEALQFIKEQRVRVLLGGSWFPNTTTAATADASAPYTAGSKPTSWRFVKLSYNRRHLHYDDFDQRAAPGSEPALEALDYKLDLSTVSSVVSNVTAAESPTASSSTLKSPGIDDAARAKEDRSRARTDIVIHGHVPEPAAATNPSGKRRPNGPQRHASSDTTATSKAETPLLTLRPETQTLAAEWLDGLLMLLNQTPITSETNRLMDFIARYGRRIRMLNVRFEEPSATGGVLEMPSREGLDEDYFYDMVGAGDVGGGAD